ncbi:MAG: hypothetical protein AAGK97_18710, partial [Bacteroidota bacterium]
MRLVFIISAIILCCSLGKTQDNFSSLEDVEKEMALYADIFTNVEMAAHRSWAVKKFNALFETALKMDGASSYPFDSLRWLMRQEPEDKSFRIFTWQEKVNQKKYNYYGMVQLKDGTFFPLHDKSEGMEDIEYNVLNDQDWYGALYYNIKPFKMKKGMGYLLFGLDYHNFYNRRKVVDVLII